jgi:hypothetical protein
MDCGLALGFAAAGRSGRLAIGRDDLVPSFDQRIETRHREVRRSHENYPQNRSP